MVIYVFEKKNFMVLHCCFLAIHSNHEMWLPIITLERTIVANYPGLTGRLPVFLAFPGLPPVYSIAIEFPGFFLELLHKPT